MLLSCIEEKKGEPKQVQCVFVHNGLLLLYLCLCKYLILFEFEAEHLSNKFSRSFKFDQMKRYDYRKSANISEIKSPPAVKLFISYSPDHVSRRNSSQTGQPPSMSARKHVATA